jgi:hypothetical protein
MRWFVVLSAVVGLGALGAACGLDGSGISPDEASFDGSTERQPRVDAGPTAWGLEGGPEPPPPPGGYCPGADASACAVPAGWNPIQYTANRNTACKDGFTQIDALAGPFNGSVACSACTGSIAVCTISALPNCAGGTLTEIMFDNGGDPGTCGSTAPVPVAFTAGSTPPYCMPIPTSDWQQLTHLKAQAPAPTPGACALGAGTSPAVTGTQVRACKPKDDSCAGQLCAAKAECIEHDGPMACPGAPYTTRTLVGDEVAFDCGGCGGCKFDAVCSGTLTLYAGAGCTGDGDAVPIPVNKTCSSIAHESSGELYQSVGYVGKAEQQPCVAVNKTGTAPNTVRNNVHTICCR